MHADGDLEPLGLSPDRIKLLVAKQRLSNGPVNRRGHGAKLFAPPDLLDSLRHAPHRQDPSPLQAIRLLLAHTGHPGVVAMHERGLETGILGQRLQEDRGKDDLHVHPTHVHVLQPRSRVGQRLAL